MPKVKLLTDDIEFEVDAGESLMEACEDEGASILFGCRSAGCGVCLINITKGLDNLNEKCHDEVALLEALGASENNRLCCKVMVEGDMEFELAL
ncbi:2Fe-2S iron-sulfur cluster-binding protein [Agarilytica rhodophyticola]|uniref:2Fe-2S iron-sulfur cluster-binding protein n=1 Tax=Agarilytica rhodophyticola TaxID=1737490 RepID=UPI000CD7FFCA|nr:2Fe-2S iron-sulfur cluster-binding protein [Agarilytica rhodophyticola]